jgi:membrane protein implicated in regulation of membrane protease activity
MEADPDPGLEPGEARRTKWLFALALCPACYLGFVLAAGGGVLSGVGAFFLGRAWLLALSVAAIVGGLLALLVWRGRRRESCGPCDVTD